MNYLYNLLIACLIICIIFIYLLIRKIPLKALGLTRKNFLRSTIRGFIIGSILIILLLLKCLITKSWNWKNDSFYLLFMFIYLLIFVSLYEEIIFRGFLGQLLYLFLPHWLGYILGALIFSSFHLMALTINDLTLGEIIIKQAPSFISLFGFHLLFQWAFIKDHNLSASVIMHFIWDFSLLLFVNVL